MHTGDAPSKSQSEVPTYLRTHVSRLALQTSAPRRALGRHVWLRNAWRQVKAAGVATVGATETTRDCWWAGLPLRASLPTLDRTRGTGSNSSLSGSLPHSEQNSGQWRVQGPQALVKVISLWDACDHGESLPQAWGYMWTSSRPVARQDVQMENSSEPRRRRALTTDPGPVAKSTPSREWQ